MIEYRFAMERQPTSEVRLNDLAREVRDSFMSPRTFNLANPLESTLSIARQLIEQRDYDPFRLLSELSQQTELSPCKTPMLLDTPDQETWQDFLYDLCAAIIDAEVERQFPEVIDEFDRRVDLHSHYHQG